MSDKSGPSSSRSRILSRNLTIDLSDPFRVGGPSLLRPTPLPAMPPHDPSLIPILELFDSCRHAFENYVRDLLRGLKEMNLVDRRQDQRTTPTISELTIFIIAESTTEGNGEFVVAAEEILSKMYEPTSGFHMQLEICHPIAISGRRSFCLLPNDGFDAMWEIVEPQIRKLLFDSLDCYIYDVVRRGYAETYASDDAVLFLKIQQGDSEPQRSMLDTIEKMVRLRGFGFTVEVRYHDFSGCWGGLQCFNRK